MEQELPITESAVEQAPAPMSKRDAVLKRLKDKYPERSLEADDDIYGAVADDYDEYDSKLKDYENDSRALSDMLAKSPKSASFLTDMAQGVDPVIGLVRNYGMEIRDILDDPAKQEELAEANKEYVERVTRSNQLEEEYNMNLQKSLEELRVMQENEGLSDEQVDQAITYLIGIFQNLLVGKFTPDSIHMALNALNYDKAVATASQEGEIRGRNAKIEEKYRRPDMSDGLPMMGGQNAPAPSATNRARSIFDEAREA
jgi:hypothetical protein